MKRSATALSLSLACALLGGALLLGAAAVVPTSASAAAYIHPFVKEFGPDGTINTRFERPRYVAVDQSSHRIYVADIFRNRIYRFNADGSPSPFTAGAGAGTNALPGPAPPSSEEPPIMGIAVAPAGAAGGTAGNIYVAWTRVSDVGSITWGVAMYSSEGAHLGELDGSGNPHHSPTNTFAAAHPCGVTVDPSGAVYVGYCNQPEPGWQPPHIDKYVPSGNPVSEADFDSEVVNAGGGGLLTTAAGLYGGLTRFDYSLFPGGGGSADASGQGTTLPIPARLAVDPVSNEKAGVQRLSSDPGSGHLFLAGRTGPVGSEAAIYELSELGEIQGKIKVEGQHLGVEGTGVDAGSGQVFATIYGQEPAKIKVRVYGAGIEVAPPLASIEPVTGITYQSAHFAGTVNAGGSGATQATTYRFQCTPACPGLQGERSVPADGADHAVSDDASELSPETSYEVTLVASNAEGVQSVEDTVSFETPAKPTAAAPEVTIDPVTEITAETAHLSGTVDPNGSGEPQATTYRFEYSDGSIAGDGSEAQVWTALPQQGPIEGDSPQPVSAELEGLQPNTPYTVRLRAENLGGVAFSALPDPGFTTALAPPAAETSPASRVLETSVRLNGRVDSRNAATTFHFEWGSADCATNPCTTVPVSEDDGEMRLEGEVVSVHAELTGLSPQTTYHYRLVAESAGGQSAGEDVAFTTAAPAGPCANLRSGFSAGLPQCRAYEMVSPLDKSGGSIAGNSFRTRASEDGNAVAYVSQAAFAGTEGFPYSGAEYLSTRGPGGWSTHSITPPQKSPFAIAAFSSTGYVGSFSGDLEAGVYRLLAPNPGASPNVEGMTNLYLATGLRSGAPTMHLLSDSVNPLGEEFLHLGALPHIWLVGRSADSGKVVFETTDNLTAGTSGAEYKLYEWEAGEVRLAGILPDSACGSPPCAAPHSVGGKGAQVNNGAKTNMETANAVSRDGSRVFFTAGDLQLSDRDLGYTGSLYARIDGSATVQIDASERTQPDPAGPGRSEFQWASPDGEEVLFFSTEALVDGDEDGQRSLYRYRFDALEGEHLSLVAPQLRAVRVVAASADGEFVYVHGGVNLYVIHEGRLRRVPTPPASSSSVTPPFRRPFDNQLELGEVAFETGGQAHLAAGGRKLLFQYRMSLTSYQAISETGCAGKQGLGGKDYEYRCRELYLYSYDEDELTCVSCNPSGAPAQGDVDFDLPLTEAGHNGTKSTNLNRPISEDGRYVFFSSPDPLVERDTNGRYDAYVYDTARQEHRLLSSGQCDCDSAFLTASPDGRDAFFTTRQQLVRADTDNLFDLYDARIGGGIAAQNALPPAECQGDACQPAPSPPNDPTPASSAFHGAGNVVAAPRGKGNRKKHKQRHRKRRQKAGKHKAGKNKLGKQKSGKRSSGASTRGSHK